MLGISGDVDDRSPVPNGFGSTKNFSGDGGDFADTRGIGAALSVDIGVKQDGHQEGDGREDQHQRAHGPRPVRGHPVPGEVARGRR